MIRARLVAVTVWVAMALHGVAAAQSAPHPWEGAQALVKAIEADVKTSGVKGIGAHVTEMEAALAEARTLPADGVVDGDTRYVLIDGPAQSMGALVKSAAVPTGSGVSYTRTIETPYPIVGFYLGSYYNEVGRFEDALKALDTALSIDGVDPPGEFRPVLVAERGAALTGLKRWPESLSNYEDGLKLRDVPDRYRARLQRGRGFALVELDRLEEGQAAYEESLRLEPGNSVATRELQYIARVKAGGQRTGTQLTLPGQQ